MLRIVLTVFRVTHVPMGMTLVKVLLVWCMYSDVTELEPRTLQAAASPPHSGPGLIVSAAPAPLSTASSETEALGRKRHGREKMSTAPTKEPQVTSSNFSSNTGPRPNFPGWPTFAVGNGYVQGMSRSGGVDWRVEGDQLFFSLQSLLGPLKIRIVFPQRVQKPHGMLSQGRT